MVKLKAEIMFLGDVNKDLSLNKKCRVVNKVFKFCNKFSLKQLRNQHVSVEFLLLLIISIQTHTIYYFVHHFKLMLLVTCQ